MVQNDNRKVQYYKRMYLQSTRMLLVHMNEEPWPIPDNTEGTWYQGATHGERGAGMQGYQ